MHEMFSSLPTPRLRNYRTILTSVGAHCAVLAAIILHHPKIVELTPMWLAYGDGSHSYRVVYVPQSDHQSRQDQAQEEKLVLPQNAPVAAARRARSSALKPPHEQTPLEAEVSNHSAKAGSPLGTVIDGPIVGHEVHVAYPVVFPEPPVARSQIPADLSGDVIIEVTIDATGNVVETRILEAIGHGIDEKIEATLRQWRYQPATLDGVPVASRHDVHFHFPS